MFGQGVPSSADQVWKEAERGINYLSISQVTGGMLALACLAVNPLAAFAEPRNQIAGGKPPPAIYLYPNTIR